MRWLFSPSLRPFILLTAITSLVLNLTMLIPALFMLQVFDRVFTSRSLETLTMLTLLVVLGLILMYFMDTTRAAALSWAGRLIDQRLGPRAIQGLIQDTARMEGPRQRFIVRDVGLLRTFLTGNGIFALFDAPWVPIYLFVIFLFHPLLGIAATAGAIVLFLLAVLNERLTKQPTEQALQSSRTASRYIDSATRNAEAIVGMGMAERVVGHWQALNQEAMQAQSRLASVNTTLGATVRAFRHGMQVAMLAIGAWLVVKNSVTPGVMVAGTILLARALHPLELLITGWKSLLEARGAWQRIADQPDIVESDSGVVLPVPKGQLDLERVIYGGGPGRPPIIKGVSFTVAPGEMLGLIGPSAAGKSTLARLILGIWKPHSGNVRLDGADTSNWDRQHLGMHVGYLPQDVELFAGTVAENIARLGPVDSETIIKAAQQANAHEMILRLPLGYDTQIGEAGATLSGGQRQRIALARALYGEPALVILDEPNANLDRDGEMALLDALDNLKKRRTTVIVIGHRPSIVARVDKIAALNEGQLEAFGPAADILMKYMPPRAAGVPDGRVAIA